MYFDSSAMTFVLGIPLVMVLFVLPFVGAPRVPGLPVVAAPVPPAVPAPAFDLVAWAAEMDLGPEVNDSGPGRIRRKVYLITFARVLLQTIMHSPHLRDPSTRDHITFCARSAMRWISRNWALVEGDPRTDRSLLPRRSSSSGSNIKMDPSTFTWGCCSLSLWAS